MKPTTKMSLLVILLVGMMTVFSSSIAATEERMLEIELDPTKISDQGYGIPSYGGLVEVGKLESGVETSTFRAIYTGDFQVLTRLEITKATVTLPRHMERYQTGDSSGYTISIYAIEKPWFEIRPIKWEENMPVINLSNGVVGKWVVNPDREDADIAEMMPAFDVTELLREGPVHGFVVKLTNESGEDARSVFPSPRKNSPVLRVVTSTPAPPEMEADWNNNGLYSSDYLNFLEKNPISTSNLSIYDALYTKEYIEVHGEVPYPPGDFNRDASVDSLDYKLLINHVNNNEPYDPRFDLNDDGFVTIIGDREKLFKTNTLPFLVIPPPIETGDLNNNGYIADCDDWNILIGYYVAGEATDDDITLMYDIARRASHMKEFGDNGFRREADMNLDGKITIADHMLMRENTLMINLTSTEAPAIANPIINVNAFDMDTTEAKEEENNKGGEN